ncbi:MAG: chitin deacetylase [Benjaminiella poitrasii]|nr:MAG: chitin deacetylase [Benjaminiella poitrasii]
MVFILPIVLSAAAVVSADTLKYYQNFTTQIDPKNITIPSIPQTTSLDPTTECTYYNPDPSLFQVVGSEWPTIWQRATTNGMNETKEFKNLYNSIDWSKAPNIPVRTLTADGGLDTTNYNSSDPDCWWSATTCTKPKITDVNEDIYYCPEPETWGLTYDDGPNCSHNAFYDFLSEQKLKATMFYIGSNVIDWPYGAMRGIKDGHHIASHTWSHPQMTTLTNQEVLAEFYYTQKAIKLATGVTPRYWRPPYGDVDDRVRWIATQLGLTAVIWDRDTNDWNAGVSVTVETVEKTYEQFIEMGSNGTYADSGNIVLTHEINNTTMSLAIENLPKIMASYKQVLSVATCQNISYPYFEDIEWTDVLNATSNSNTTSNSNSSTTATQSNGTLAAQANSPVSAGTTFSPNIALIAVVLASLIL